MGLEIGDGVTVLLNPAAGDAGNLTAHIAALFLAAGCDARIVELAQGEDPADAARSAAARTRIVVAAGGDGTVSRVAGGLAGTPAVLGVIPIGTLNHFAKDLGIPLDLEHAVATIVARHVEGVDVGRVNGRVFINNSSIGVYPSIVEAREELRRQGHGKWVAFALATLHVLRRYRGVAVWIAADGQTLVRRTPFVFVGNNEYVLDGIHLGGRTRLDRGQLVVYLAPRLRVRELPMLLATAMMGRARQSGAFEIVAVPELTVNTRRARKIRVALDGEIVTMTTPLRYCTCPGALNVLLPVTNLRRHGASS